MGRLAFRDTLVQAFNFGMKNKDEERTKILN